MKKSLKIFLIAGGVLLSLIASIIFVVCVFGAMCYHSVKEYHDDNTWVCIYVDNEVSYAKPENIMDYSYSCGEQLHNTTIEVRHVSFDDAKLYVGDYNDENGNKIDAVITVKPGDVIILTDSSGKKVTLTCHTITWF